MAILCDWVRESGTVTDVYMRLTRDTVVTYRSYLVEAGKATVPAGSGRAAQGAAPAEADGMVRSESGLAALALYRGPDDRAAGLDPIGGTRVDLVSGPALDTVFARVEAGDRDGALAAIYVAVKGRIASDPMLAAHFVNLRDA